MTVRQLGQRSDERLRLSVRHALQNECPQLSVAGSWSRFMQIGHSKAFSSESVAATASGVSNMALTGRRGTGESSATPAEPSATESTDAENIP